MNRMKIARSLVLILGLAGLAGAQTPAPSREAGNMYEDIEVMRRILAQTIKDRWNSLYPSSMSAIQTYVNWLGPHGQSGIVNPMRGDLPWGGISITLQ